MSSRNGSRLRRSRRGWCRGCRATGSRRACGAAAANPPTASPFESPSRRSRSATSLTCTNASASATRRGERRSARPFSPCRRRGTSGPDRRAPRSSRSSHSPSSASPETPAPNRPGAAPKTRVSGSPRRRAAASSFHSSSSSRSATARAARSSSTIWSGKVSRKMPEMRDRHVDARMVEQRRGDDLEAGHAGRGSVPARADAHQRQRMRHVLAAGAQGRRGPQVHDDAARIIALVLQVPADDLGGGARAQGSGGAGRDGAGIEGREVAAGRHHVAPSARGRARRARE